MEKRDINELLGKAREAKRNAYAPYSGFCVGAAVLTEGGKIYTGCNVENASFTPTCCAERVAVFSAVADGERSFRAIAVAGDSRPCYPCGVCRQVLSELCGEDMAVILEEEKGSPRCVTLGELLPFSFKLKKTTDSEKK